MKFIRAGACALALMTLFVSAPGAAFAGSTVVSLTFAGTARSSILHVPANYSDGTAYPLILVLHAMNETAAQMENVTEFDAMGDSDNFFVAYPESVGSQWVTTGTTNDVQFSVALLQTIEASYHIDPTRVYVAGYSQGARLAQQIAFCNPTLVAGVGDVAEDLDSTWQSTCKLATPISYVLFHGTADPFSPYNGRSVFGLTTYSAMQTATNWAQVDGCANGANPSSSTYPDALNSGVKITDTLYTWNGCSSGTTVAFYSIPSGGHTWPGGLQTKVPPTTMGPTSMNTNASQIMWQTFSPQRSAAAFAGACGSASGVATASAPASGLCQTGLASAVRSGSLWTWTCSGYNGGAGASCSAPTH